MAKGTYEEPDVYSGRYQPYSPYKQSRRTLRQQFGPRAIDASAPPSVRNMSSTAVGVGTFGGGLTAPDRWTNFFRPAAQKTQTAAAPVPVPATAGASPITPWSEAPEGSFAPSGYEGPRTPIPVSPALPAAPVDYLQAAHQRSTQWMNAQGAGIAAPMAGAVQAGTSFRNKFGTGSVASESENRFKRLMRNATLPKLFDVSDV